MTPRESAAVAAPAEQGRQGPPEQVPPRPAPAGADPREAGGGRAAAGAAPARAGATDAQGKGAGDAFTSLFEKGLMGEQQARQAQNNEKPQGAAVVVAQGQVGPAQADAERAR